MFTLHAPIPVLRIFDEARARAHYIDFLGFTMDWEHRFGNDFPLFMQISRNSCVIQLSEHHGDACPGAAIKIETTGLDEFCQVLNDKKYKYCKPGVEEMPWGARQTQIADPFGNRLIFFEPAISAAAAASHPR